MAADSGSRAFAQQCAQSAQLQMRRRRNHALGSSGMLGMLGMLRERVRAGQPASDALFKHTFPFPTPDENFRGMHGCLELFKK